MCGKYSFGKNITPPSLLKLCCSCSLRMYREMDAWEFIAALPRSFYVATLTSIDQLDQ